MTWRGTVEITSACGCKPKRPRIVPASKLVSTRIKVGNFGDHKGLGKGVSELRIDFGPGYCVYYGRDGDSLVILLAGGTKKRQARDIEKAQALWNEYKQEK